MNYENLFTKLKQRVQWRKRNEDLDTGSVNENNNFKPSNHFSVNYRRGPFGGVSFDNLNFIRIFFYLMSQLEVV